MPNPGLPYDKETDTYSPGEAAKVLGISIDTLKRWERQGRIAATRVGGDNSNTGHSGAPARRFTREAVTVLADKLQKIREELNAQQEEAK